MLRTKDSPLIQKSFHLKQHEELKVISSFDYEMMCAKEYRVNPDFDNVEYYRLKSAGTGNIQKESMKTNIEQD